MSVVEAGERNMSEPDYRGFARWVIREGPWSGTSLYGGEIEDMAVRFGIIRRVLYDPEFHGDNDLDVQPGDPWFEFVDGERQQRAMMTRCLRCGGRGWVWIEPEMAATCPRCDGDGEVFTEFGPQEAER